MQCLLIGEHGPQRSRLQRLLREAGWHQIVMSSTECATATIPQDLDLAILAFASSSQSLNAEIEAVRRASRAAIILVLGDFSVDARLRALALGATDFVQHSVSGKLLLARVRALMRLRGNPTDGIFEAGSLQVDLHRLRAREYDRELKLSQKEFKLLAFLVQHRGQTLTRTELIERLWEDGSLVEDNALEVQVSRLRRKLTSSSCCRIATVRGIGYRLDIVAGRPPPALTQTG